MMPIVPLPKELIKVLVKNPETGKFELPPNATQEQRTVFADHEKRVAAAQYNAFYVED